jgi:hypothetical protein
MIMRVGLWFVEVSLLSRSQRTSQLNPDTAADFFANALSVRAMLFVVDIDGALQQSTN